jgi:cellulose synthase/poly-beta-1,6-N-acetylglucosamine synthase-like glycosyltransferase
MAPMFLVTLIGCFLFAIYGVLIDYYRRAWTAIPPFTPAGGVRPARTKISVLVPARNEEANIAACIASLALQSYPRHLYEVIVIDDHSTDRTLEIVRELFYPELTLLCLRLAETTQDQPVLAHKKWAIETGIQTATGELIVTTDADCLFHPGWLATIAAFYEEKNAKFIAAPVRIGGATDPGRTADNADHSSPGWGHHSLLAIFQTLDFITLQGITGAAVSKRFHSMCNGANLAYARSAFYEVEGFKGIDSLPSGDDMLLMHKIYRQYPGGVFFLKSPKAIVTTRPETRWKGFFNQRIRWASKADRYDDKRIFWVLLLVYILNALFAVLPVAAFWNRWWLWLLLLGLVVKTMLEYPFVRTVATFFGQRSLMVYFPLLQPLHILYTIVIGWLGKFGSYRWKDRKISK